MGIPSATFSSKIEFSADGKSLRRRRSRSRLWTWRTWASILNLDSKSRRSKCRQRGRAVSSSGQSMNLY